MSDHSNGRIVDVQPSHNPKQSEDVGELSAPLSPVADIGIGIAESVPRCGNGTHRS